MPDANLSLLMRKTSGRSVFCNKPPTCGWAMGMAVLYPAVLYLLHCRSVLLHQATMLPNVPVETKADMTEHIARTIHLIT
jgi:hypothetical protein